MCGLERHGLLACAAALGLVYSDGHLMRPHLEIICASLQYIHYSI